MIIYIFIIQIEDYLFLFIPLLLRKKIYDYILYLFSNKINCHYNRTSCGKNKHCLRTQIIP